MSLGKSPVETVPFSDADERVSLAGNRMHALVDDFLQHLRTERGQSENTQKTYAALLARFVNWANEQRLDDWPKVQFPHLTHFLQSERDRALLTGEKTNERQPDPDKSHIAPGSITRRLSSESVYLQIAALRAFYRYAENEKLV